MPNQYSPGLVSGYGRGGRLKSEVHGMNSGFPILNVERAAVSMYMPYADSPENEMKKGIDA